MSNFCHPSNCPNPHVYPLARRTGTQARKCLFSTGRRLGNSSPGSHCWFGPEPKTARTAGKCCGPRPLNQRKTAWTAETARRRNSRLQGRRRLQELQERKTAETTGRLQASRTTGTQDCRDWCFKKACSTDVLQHTPIMLLKRTQVISLIHPSTTEGHRSCRSFDSAAS